MNRKALHDAQLVRLWDGQAALGLLTLSFLFLLQPIYPDQSWWIQRNRLQPGHTKSDLGQLMKEHGKCSTTENNWSSAELEAHCLAQVWSDPFRGPWNSDYWKTHSNALIHSFCEIYYSKVTALDWSILYLECPYRIYIDYRIISHKPCF